MTIAFSELKPLQTFPPSSRPCRLSRNRLFRKSYDKKSISIYTQKIHILYARSHISRTLVHKQWNFPMSEMSDDKKFDLTTYYPIPSDADELGSSRLGL